ncbi:hypothetical protein D3C75_1327950 [compost metagenome]
MPLAVRAGSWPTPSTPAWAKAPPERSFASSKETVRKVNIRPTRPAKGRFFCVPRSQGISDSTKLSLSRTIYPAIE